MGTCGVCLVDACIAKLEVGAPELSTGECGRNYVHNNKPLNHANWDSLNWTTPPVAFDITESGPISYPTCGNTMMGAACAATSEPPEVESISYNFCFGDVNGSGGVNIDDLLAVINGWGNCPPLPMGVSTGPLPPCPPDVSPHICGDGLVNIDDLLVVINNWGPCHHPTCGLQQAVGGETSESAPQNVSDCWNDCSTKCGDNEGCWLQCYQACLESLRQRGLIE